jgi:hypothetical protein
VVRVPPSGWLSQGVPPGWRLTAVWLTIATQRTDHGVSHAAVCRALEVPESTFDKWLVRPLTPSQVRRSDHDEAVKESFDDSGGTPGTYGSPTVFIVQRM